MHTVDVECYRNYFSVQFEHIENGERIVIDRLDNELLDVKRLTRLMGTNTTVSFNGNSYDLYMIAAAIKGYNNQQLKRISDKFIKSNAPPWKTAKDLQLFVPRSWDHIDIIEVAAGTASLKMYGARLNAQTIQDLPYHPDDTITENMRQELVRYCFNDLALTKKLYLHLIKQIKLREQIGEKYGLDLRSKSDAQIAETVIKSEMTKLTGKDYRPAKYDSDAVFKYQNPQIISFKTEQLRDIFERVLACEFELSGNGSIQLPQWLSKTKIKLGGTEYQMGIGGLHSCESCQSVYADDKHLLIDADVASYYPSIILQQNLAPVTMGRNFITLYQRIVNDRLAAKHSGDKVTADTLKIVVNGSYGKLGSKYSALYSPELLIQTTLTGQLALLMLIESLELSGINVVSANTDGIVIRCPIEKEELLGELLFDWEITTTYMLEFTRYKSLHSRDVNNYVAVKLDGSVKRKGVFAEPTIAKNPETTICYDAVAAVLAGKSTIERTIKDCADISRFCLVRRVTGGANWRGDDIGKTVRYYWSSDVPMTEQIAYAKNGNKVPKSDGAKPCQTLPDVLPTDIDYARYIAFANEILKGVGYE